MENSSKKLFKAILDENLEDIRKLVFQDNDVINFTNEWEQSILLFSVEYGKVQGVETLLSLGADATIPDDEGKTPLIAASFWGNEGFV